VVTSSGSATFVGVDIGGTTVDAVAVDRSNNVIASAAQPTRVDDGDGLVDSAVRAVRAALNDLPAGRDDVRSIGVGVPGVVDLSNGSVRLAMNINIGEESFPIGPKVEAEFGLPTAVENDVRVAALGAFETFEGPGRELRTLVFIGVGTGISAGLVLDGWIYRGRDGLAGEIGHVPVVNDGPPCRCGLTGCLEAVAAGPAIARLWPSNNGRPAEELFGAADAGHPEAVLAAGIIAGHLATAVHFVSSAYDPDLIVLGGGVGSVGDPLLSAVKSCLADSAHRSPLVREVVPPERLVSVPKGLAVGAIGAAAVARKRFGGDRGAEHSAGGGWMPGRKGESMWRGTDFSS
jgi:glucokinase